MRVAHAFSYTDARVLTGLNILIAEATEDRHRAEGRGLDLSLFQPLYWNDCALRGSGNRWQKWHRIVVPEIAYGKANPRCDEKGSAWKN